MTLTARFKHLQWDESTTAEPGDGLVFKEAEVAYAYEGDLEGRSTLRYQLCYAGEQAAHFVGFERFEGRLSGREGTLVWRNEGAWEDGAAVGGGPIVAGTGALAGVTGEVRFRAVHAPENTLTLEVTLPAP
ncbi:MAG: DUF3224 domain-containing protein [Alphaproteobacteria bacterium]|nr:DUF3224 domain-containing protein [Alphaproteobacteria bacterium]